MASRAEVLPQGNGALAGAQAVAPRHRQDLEVSGTVAQSSPADNEVISFVRRSRSNLVSSI